jgi:hypothetical protein
MIEQVLVRSVKCLQGLIGLLWLANQVELSEGCVKQGHEQGNSNSMTTRSGARRCLVKRRGKRIHKVSDFTCFSTLRIPAFCRLMTSLGEHQN